MKYLAIVSYDPLTGFEEPKGRLLKQLFYLKRAAATVNINSAVWK